MGFSDALLGGKKQGSPKNTPKRARPAAAECQAPAAADPADGLTPEVIAAISASVGIVMEETDDAELVAAMTAAIVHARGGGLAVRFKRSSKAWAASGRQRIMAGRRYR